MFGSEDPFAHLGQHGDLALSAAAMIAAGAVAIAYGNLMDMLADPDGNPITKAKLDEIEAFSIDAAVREAPLFALFEKGVPPNAAQPIVNFARRMARGLFDGEREKTNKFYAGDL